MSWPIIRYMLCCLDVLALAASLAVALGSRHFTGFIVTDTDILFLCTVAAVLAGALCVAGCYARTSILDYRTEFQALLLGSGLTLAGAVLVWTLGGSAHNLSPFRLDGVAPGGTFLLAAAFLLSANRIAVFKTTSRLHTESRLRERLVLVGAGSGARLITQHITEHQTKEIDLIGIFDDRKDRVPHDIDGFPVVGSTDALVSFVRHHPVDRLIITLPWTAESRILALLRKLRTVPVRIDLCPTSVIWRCQTANVHHLAGIPLITIANGRLGRENRLLKMIEDRFLGTALFLLALPVMLVIALLVRADSPGPALFRQERHGFNNQIFTIFKFRSMRNDSPTDPNVEQAKRSDPRVTRLGRFLRKTSLDELPQLLNVLRGEMSLVGPRPHAIPHNIMYAAIIDEYFARHNVKPGITGWAQINGLRGEIDRPEKMQERVTFDLYYVENWSLWLDFKIVMQTALKVWFQKAAY